MRDKLFAENSMIPCGDRMAKATRAARSKEVLIFFFCCYSSSLCVSNTRELTQRTWTKDNVYQGLGRNHASAFD
ncbi:hypothetical protein TNCT_647271 [Trichonephila clavata]|uniref:Uncharacterized protein n=1 Tax=Trichonephila clavata TaxID=2740835 RepID=A0A8X6LVW5_TRICU|nr:hypothetical protein TNCT_647271 [Trichonephila clavata]